MRSLNEKFKNVVCAIEVAKDLEELMIEELAGSLEAHEQRKNRKKQESLDEALQTKVVMEEIIIIRIGNNHPISIRKSHVAGDADVEEENMNIVQRLIVTIVVSMVIMPKIAKRTEENTNLVTEPQVEESGILLIAHEEQISEVDTMWYLDSDASNHMSGQKDLFVEMTEVVQGHVSFGDESKIDVKGRGIRMGKKARSKMCTMSLL
ncbi:hypothetical protein Tco_1398480 [Tanacetum coccineum]